MITQETLRIDMNTAGKKLTLITKPSIVVDAGALSLVHSKIKIRQAPDHGTPITLRVELVGTTTHGRVVVRPARRTFGQWLLRKPPSLPAGD
ncbi:hypothetical protein [Streptomyces sp. R41]|uniref:Uncharacterized protein n=1 Tax=Streptomyces sp. R41 TaxID=3238632 RepID=A0AB39R5L6_9ACTN